MWARQRISGQPGTGLVPLTLAPATSGFRQYSELIHPFFLSRAQAQLRVHRVGWWMGMNWRFPFGCNRHIFFKDTWTFSVASWSLWLLLLFTPLHCFLPHCGMCVWGGVALEACGRLPRSETGCRHLRVGNWAEFWCSHPKLWSRKLPAAFTHTPCPRVYFLSF